MRLFWHESVEVPTEPPPDLHAATHASRTALERVLTDPDAQAAWAFLAATYAEMAAEWQDWVVTQPWYDAPVRDGLRHAKPAAWAFEVSCGTGEATAAIAGQTGRVVATDANLAMLRRAPRRLGVEYVRSDVRALPLRDASVPLLVGLNGVPHIKEFTRVIADGGQLLWCSSYGAGTPLYVEPERLLQLFGPGWTGQAGRAGHGDWLLLSREA
jgi:hypothetical protein